MSKSFKTPESLSQVLDSKENHVGSIKWMILLYSIQLYEQKLICGNIYNVPPSF